MKKIFYNGRVYGKNGELKEAFITENDKFIYVGENEKALEQKENSELVDLEGKLVLPGFNDSHMHLISTGSCLNMVDLTGATSIDDLIERGKEYIAEKNYDKDYFIMGFGWNNDFLEEKRFPTRHDLDKITTEYPIVYIRTCYHIYVANSKALELSGITKDTEEIDGGAIDLDEDGEPLGILRENAVSLITSKITALKPKEIKESILKGIEYCNSMGITSIGTDDLCEFATVNYDVIIKCFKELAEEGRLKARINQQCRFHSIEDYSKFLEQGYNAGYGSEYFKIGPLKLMVDGALGARTAYLNQPYNDDKGNRGLLAMKPEKLQKWVELAHKNNMQVAAHSIGDGAAYEIIKAYEKAIKDFPREDNRHGLVHAQITDKYVLDKMKELDLIAYIQTIFLDYDAYIAESRLGEVSKDSYKFKTMLNMNIPVANGSDAPVEWPDVFKGMQIAITRTPIEGNSAFYAEEGYTIKEAIDSFTIGGAYSTFEENIKGTIEEGKYADFVILDRNILEENPYDLKNTKVLETYLGGKQIYKKEN